jgi:Catalytic LigB subunit of aromatic ring-opening dioxygenase
MAELIAGFATSHTPILALVAEEWEARAVNDRKNPKLWDTTGVPRTYPELAQLAGDRYAPLAVPSVWNEQYENAQRDLDRLAAALEAAAPDVLIIVGDDEQELFSLANFPAVSIFYGERATMLKMALSPDPEFAWRKTVSVGYGMDKQYQHAAAPELARELIDRLMDDGFDIGAAASVPNPDAQGFGHAYGFVVTRLMARRRIPIVPVMVNCYYPPNQPKPARCFALGQALRRAIEAAPGDARVAILASGGLSHFVTNEALDTAVLDALRADDHSALARLPAELLNSGSSEIRNWITVGGALGDLKNDFVEYYPVYRTPAGTGCGMAFASWS